MTFCDWWRLRRDLDAVFAALYAVGRARLAGQCPRVAVRRLLGVGRGPEGGAA